MRCSCAAWTAASSACRPRDHAPARGGSGGGATPTPARAPPFDIRLEWPVSPSTFPRRPKMPQLLLGTCARETSGGRARLDAPRVVRRGNVLLAGVKRQAVHLFFPLGEPPERGRGRRARPGLARRRRRGQLRGGGAARSHALARPLRWLRRRRRGEVRRALSTEGAAERVSGPAAGRIPRPRFPPPRKRCCLSLGGEERARSVGAVARPAQCLSWRAHSQPPHLPEAPGW